MRELANLVERMAILHPYGFVGISERPPGIVLIQQALADTGAVVARAAKHLASRRTTLVEKMRKYGLHK